MKKLKFEVYDFHAVLEAAQVLASKEEKRKVDFRNYANSLENYQDFWHFILDVYPEISNGCVIYIDWNDLRETARQEKKPWVMKICDYFAEIVGGKATDGYYVEW